MEFKEGADVYTSKGEKAADIDRVVIDPLTDEITHLVVRKEFLFPEDRVVSTDLVHSATEDRVILKDVEDIEALPVFEQVHYIRLDRVTKDSATHQAGYVSPYTSCLSEDRGIIGTKHHGRRMRCPIRYMLSGKKTLTS